MLVTVYADLKTPDVVVAAAEGEGGRTGRDAVAVLVAVAQKALGYDGGSCSYGYGYESGCGCGRGCGRLPIENAGSQIVFGQPWITP